MVTWYNTILFLPKKNFVAPLLGAQELGGPGSLNRLNPRFLRHWLVADGSVVTVWYCWRFLTRASLLYGRAVVPAGASASRKRHSVKRRLSIRTWAPTPSVESLVYSCRQIGLVPTLRRDGYRTGGNRCIAGVEWKCGRSSRSHPVLCSASYFRHLSSIPQVGPAVLFRYHLSTTSSHHHPTLFHTSLLLRESFPPQTLPAM